MKIILIMKYLLSENLSSIRQSSTGCTEQQNETHVDQDNTGKDWSVAASRMVGLDSTDRSRQDLIQPAER